jgi:hypothetical protein
MIFKSWGLKKRFKKVQRDILKNEEYTQKFRNNDKRGNREIDESHMVIGAHEALQQKSGRINARNWETNREIGTNIRQ